MIPVPFTRLAGKLLTGLAVVTAIVGLTVGPSYAWKLKTHVYLSDIALKDAIDDGKVSISCGTTKIGDYSVDPNILASIKAYPAAFYAGAMGPDAYPDIMTGQMLIHPLDYTYQWLNYLGPKGFSSQGAACAFVAGFFSHASGDLFGHTWVNEHWAGGSFQYYPDPGRATKHITVEGYVDKKIPASILATSISITPIETWMYENMVKAAPGSALESILLSGNSPKALLSLPLVFSELRTALQKDIDAYYAKKRDYDNRVNSKLDAAKRCKATDFHCSATKLRAEAAVIEAEKGKYMVDYGAVITYKEHWVIDIDDGLKAWPGISQTVSLAFYKGQSAEAEQAISNFAINHLASMAGAPDWFAPMLAVKVIPQSIVDAINDMKSSLINFLCKTAFGITYDQFKQYLLSPENMMAPQGISKTAVDADLRLTGATIDWTKVPAMVNTVTMIKLSMLSKAEVNRLISDLGGGATLQENNILEGSWFHSLDESYQWKNTETKPAMVLWQNQTLFNKVFVPDTYGLPSATPATTTTTTTGGGGGGGPAARAK